MYTFPHFILLINCDRTHNIERMADDIHEGGLPMAAQTVSGILVEETFQHRGCPNA